MTFRELSEVTALHEAMDQSSESKVIFFKHSTRCSISNMAENRLIRSSLPFGHVPCYMIEVVRHRELSNALTEVSGIKHESPQILIFENGKCTASWSHNAISPEDIWSFVK